MDRMLIILKKENGPRASCPCTGVKYHNIQICLLVYELMKQISDERLQDHWSSGCIQFIMIQIACKNIVSLQEKMILLLLSP